MIRTDDSVFEFIQDMALDGLGFWDIDRQKEWVNNKFWSTLGYEPLSPTFSPRPRQEMILAEDRDAEKENVTRAIQNPSKVHEHIVRYRHCNDSIIWFRTRIIALPGKEGKVNRVLASYQDVSRDQETASRLMIQNKRFSGILSWIKIGTWEWNVQAGETIFSEEWAAILGYTLDELRPIDINTWVKFAHPDDLVVSQQKLDEHFSGTTEFYECEVRMKHRDGRWLWILDKGKVISFTADGKPLWMAGSHINIDPVKKTQEQLAISEERFRKAFEFSAIGMALVSADGHWLKVNKQLCNITGYSEEELLTKTFQEITHPDDLEIDLQQARELLDGTIDHYRMEKRYIHKNGSVVWILLSGSLVRDNGKPLYFVSQVEDISQRKKYEADLHTSIEELEAFSYNVAHDLRAPLRNLNVCAGILLEQGSSQLKSEENKLLGMMSRSARQMGQLVDDLLNLSRVGRSPVEKEIVNPAEVISSVIEEQIQPIGHGKVQIDVKNIEPLNCDINLMRLVFSNLISNAIKYSRKKEKPVVEIGSYPAEREMVYYVKDNGAGFDMQYADKLFDPFERLHTSSEFEGTGVGLAIVKRIVVKHGGSIWVHAEVEKGATFYFSLPY